MTVIIDRFGARVGRSRVGAAAILCSVAPCQSVDAGRGLSLIWVRNGEF